MKLWNCKDCDKNFPQEKTKLWILHKGSRASWREVTYILCLNCYKKREKDWIRGLKVAYFIIASLVAFTIFSVILFPD